MTGALGITSTPPSSIHQANSRWRAVVDFPSASGRRAFADVGLCEGRNRSLVSYLASVPGRLFGQTGLDCRRRKKIQKLEIVHEHRLCRGGSGG